MGILIPCLLMVYHCADCRHLGGRTVSRGLHRRWSSRCQSCCSSTSGSAVSTSERAGQLRERGVHSRTPSFPPDARDHLRLILGYCDPTAPCWPSSAFVVGCSSTRSLMVALPRSGRTAPSRAGLHGRRSLQLRGSWPRSRCRRLAVVLGISKRPAVFFVISTVVSSCWAPFEGHLR